MDAAKHMWPADIEALQAKLNDLPSGGRPFFYMEVIDQGKLFFFFLSLFFSFCQSKKSQSFEKKTYIQ